MNQIIPQDMTICLRSAFPSVPPDCIETLMSAAYSVRNAQYHVYSFRHRLASAMTAIICGASSLHAEFAFGAGTKDVDTQLHTIMRNFKTSGAAVVVAKDGEIVYEYYYGYADKKSKKPITDSTYFRLASVTKLVTAIRTMQLVEQGALDLDRDISAYLGYDIRNPYHRKTPITLRMLMTHTSSLNPYGGYFDETRTLSSLIAFDRTKRSNWYNEVPGTKYRYSNYGAGIIGSIIESVTDNNIDDNLQENVFYPLNISASYSAGLLPDSENVATLYNTDGKIDKSREDSLGKVWDTGVDPDTHYRITIGSLWMRAEDLSRIGMLLCNGGCWNGVTLLQQETVAMMMDEQRGKGGITANTPYGLCVHHERTLVHGKTLYGHQGLCNGILVNLYYDPETRFVFVFCSNGCHNRLDNRVGKLTRRVFAVVWDAYASP